MIVKIQRPLFSSGEETVLIYDQSRSILIQQPLDSIIKGLLGDRFKGYFNARLQDDGTLEILERAFNQDW